MHVDLDFTIPALAFWSVVIPLGMMAVTRLILAPLVFRPLANLTGDIDVTAPLMPLQLLLGGPIVWVIVWFDRKSFRSFYQDGRARRAILRQRAAEKAS